MVCKDESGDLASSERATSSLTARGGVMFSNAKVSGRPHYETEKE